MFQSRRFISPVRALSLKKPSLLNFQKHVQVKPLNQSLLSGYATKEVAVRVCLPYRDVELESLLDPTQKSWWRTLSGMYLPAGKRILTAKLYWAQIQSFIDNQTMYDLTKREKGFDSWYHLALLHYWMLLVRLRKEPDSTKLAEELYNQFWNATELKMLEERKQYENPMTYSKDLKIYNNMYLGSLFAYDEGLLKGDAVFAEALWRNFYNMTFPSATTLSGLVRYVRTQLQQLDELPGAVVLAGVTPWRSAKPLPDCTVLTRAVTVDEADLKKEGLLDSTPKA